MRSLEPLERPLVKVHLYGALADRFGASHDFAIRTPREAVAALDANFPGFIAEFAKCERYILIADDNELRDDDHAPLLPVSKSIHFYPKIEGESFLGSALIGALIPSLIGVTIGGVAVTSIIGGLLFAGLALGLSLLLKPKQPDKPKADDGKKDESYAFTGPENVSQQGVAVPLIYGRVWAGSVVVSAGLSVSDEAITTT